ncbi:DUF1173 family protein [Mesorhizobium sp. 10.2.3]|uniref:DUF1173 family protein n=1 Tax=Mesorhizobium sp. 10.2.3 TaxID=1085775 RepID=UPI0032B1E2B0
MPPDLQAALADAYRRKLRPLCLCKEPCPAMYIAQGWRPIHGQADAAVGWQP